MRCCANTDANRRRVLFTLGLILARGMALAEEQDPIEVLRAQLRASEGRWWLDADTAWRALPGPWESLLRQGTAMPLKVELALLQPQWWWGERMVWAKRWRFELSYHLGWRQWRLRQGESVRVATSWQEAVAPLAHIRGWDAMAKDIVHPASDLVALLSCGVDDERLSTTLRLAATRDASIVWQSRPFRWRPWPA